MNKPQVIFLKLGGSLITDKVRPHAPRYRIIHRIAREIRSVLDLYPGIKLLLGHGSGSFGHVPASKYKTIEGVRSNKEWQGFIEVWREASALNHIVMQILADVNIPVISFPPSTAITCSNRRIIKWEVEPIRMALENNIVPVVYGDVVFDETLGGTILSTEDLFIHLSDQMHPDRILLAGEEKGVWRDFQKTTGLIDQITPRNFSEYSKSAGASKGMDVTGGMAQKIKLMVDLVSHSPKIKVDIFSGKNSGAIRDHLLGKGIGTIISA